MASLRHSTEALPAERTSGDIYPATWCPGWSGNMGIERVFRDINGIEWRVSYVTPTTAPTEGIDGWLSFEAGKFHLERHLSPVPKNWHTATIQRLEQMCRVATPIQREESATASDRFEMLIEPMGEPMVDTTTDESSKAVASSGSAQDHVSLVANSWPASGSRVTFRG
jgi:hypothetical protein